MRQCVLITMALLAASSPQMIFAADVDFNRDIRPILSNKCFACHGPDQARLKAGLRLDDSHVATAKLESGSVAIVPGHPESSELLARVTNTDADLRMPPAEFSKPLTPAEIELIRRWIQQGAPFAVHWSYVKPQRPEPPVADAAHSSWPRNPIDQFVLKRMLEQGLQPSPEADRYALARRVSLDLTGLPISVEEADAFVADQSPQAWEKLVDELLKRPAFGEHWARQWLDLARYADSAGYADDPARTIWGYRDWVVRAINSNMPFDQFTIEQLAGDLLPNPTDEQLLATAFHRNTLTNNEGGTNDEEFRNVAVVDRVNTTMAVWMGTTMACAQCHSHKYDPISQEEYFRFFAILNNTQDADRGDESPLLQLYTDEQKQKKSDLQKQVADLEAEIAAPNDAVVASQQLWEQRLQRRPDWTPSRPSSVQMASERTAQILEDATVVIASSAKTDVTTVDIPVEPAGENGASSIAAIRLQSIPDPTLPGGGAGHGGGNFVITELRAQLVPVTASAPQARYLRIEIPGQQKILSLAEVQIHSKGMNVAPTGEVSQSSTDYAGPANLAIDGNTDGNYEKKSVTHTAVSDDPWWQIDLKSEVAIEKVVIWNRTDNQVSARLANFDLKLLNSAQEVVWQQRITESPNPSAEYAPSGIKDIVLQAAYADYHQEKFEAAEILDGKTEADNGWAVGGSLTSEHTLVVIPASPVSVKEPAVLRLIIEQKSPYENHVLGRFRLSTTADETAALRSQVPLLVLNILDTPESQRDAAQKDNLGTWYREHVAPELASQRQVLADVRQQLASMKPATSVPILRELMESRRSTQLQYRGNYLDKGPVVAAGVPAAFGSSLPEGQVDRLAMAKWLVDPENPLTARVLANRYWETLFGRGIVLTSEEFGSQGEPPTHPELLDWLATEVHRTQWNTKEFLKQIVMSATYRQSARVSPESLIADLDNRWLSRGPRVRLSAEMVRDQALAVSGLLSDRMFGAPVKPPQPSLGLNAAFGSSTDWKTSDGEDRYRRGLYTTWRRSNPYPSMATFDAPNREVCTIRRNSTNTPLQSLVTLNDPVYVEAAQSLSRIALKHSDRLEDQLVLMFRRCLLRPPADNELQAMMSLFQDTLQQMQQHAEDATRLATEPIGPLPESIPAANAAALVVVGNVLLNLDEMFLKP